MSKPLTESEKYALDYLYGGVECRPVCWVKTRYSQECLSILHKGKTFPAGTWMILERAKVDGKFGSCYTCKSCIRAAAREIR